MHIEIACIFSLDYFYVDFHKSPVYGDYEIRHFHVVNFVGYTVHAVHVTS